MNTFGGFDWNLDYTHKFKKEGQELDISSQWSHSKIVNDYTNEYSGDLPSGFDNLKNYIKGINDEYTIQADYTHPFSKVFKLEAGGKEIIRRIVSTSDLYNPVPPHTTDNYVFDELNSSTYNYDQNVTAGYERIYTYLGSKGTLFWPV